jgi:hypothetical protein
LPSPRPPTFAHDPSLRRAEPPDSGLRRRRDDVDAAPWPLETGDPDAPRGSDPWAAIVRDALDRRTGGSAGLPAATWSEDVVWCVAGNGPVSGQHEGRHGIGRYHAALLERSDGTFRQRLLALQGSNGPIVTAHLRTFARRGERILDMPSLLVFELAHLRIRRVTELPGDQTAWDRFWRPEGPA